MTLSLVSLTQEITLYEVDSKTMLPYLRGLRGSVCIERVGASRKHSALLIIRSL